MNGLYSKYIVIKLSDGELVDDAFILRPECDPVALMALETYAEKTPNKELSIDLYKWITEIRQSRMLDNQGKAE